MSKHNDMVRGTMTIPAIARTNKERAINDR